MIKRVGTSFHWSIKMKLNKYIYKKLMQEEIDLRPTPITEEDIEEWITDWYKEVYDRTPPLWLVGKRWYDRRQQKIDEA